MTGRPELLLALRPHRADAARNFDAILSAAAALFSKRGSDVTMPEIAVAAGVGVATLYRNFPSREALIEAVYVAEVEDLCRHAGQQASRSADDDLDRWLRRFLVYMMTKRVLAQGLNREIPGYQACRRAIYSTAEPLLANAQKHGTVRADITADDAMRFIMAISLGVYTDDGQRDRILALGIASLHT
jgi:AcrR family transcriptional regulator